MNGMGYANGGASMLAEQKKSYNQPRKHMKIKKQGFFKRWLANKLQSVEEQDQVVESPGLIVRGEPQIDQPERAIQFTVYTANGGRVIETRRYDRQKDRNQNNLYIISNDQDFGKEIDKIITMEALR